MNDLSYAAMLRNLSSDYYYQRISKQDYRLQRRQILEKIDEEFNGKKNIMIEEQQTPESADDDQSIFMKTIAFFRNKDLEN